MSNIIRVYRDLYRFKQGFAVNVGVMNEAGEVASVVTRMELEPFDPGTITPVPLHIENAEAQQLMDDLWQAGIRPTLSKHVSGELDATRTHLRDMRAIVANRLKVEL